MNHYGNFPTHCPQWTKMNLTEKKRTTKLAEYCLRCFAPKVFIKSQLDGNRHHQTRCYVSGKNKHKFSCLNTTCLKHSWICQDHVDENKPLLAAHYKELDTLITKPKDPLIDMVTKAKANNQPYDITTVPSKVNITQNEPNTTASLSQTSPSSSCASRFDSWTHLCLGTGRRYPNPDNIFHSVNYARRPSNFHPEPRAKTNSKCRICKLLESTGKYEGELYVNHYGNFPTHCPQ